MILKEPKPQMEAEKLHNVNDTSQVIFATFRSNFLGRKKRSDQGKKSSNRRWSALMNGEG